MKTYCPDTIVPPHNEVAQCEGRERVRERIIAVGAGIIHSSFLPSRRNPKSIPLLSSPLPSFQSLSAVSTSAPRLSSVHHIIMPESAATAAADQRSDHFVHQARARLCKYLGVKTCSPVLFAVACSDTILLSGLFYADWYTRVRNSSLVNR